VLFGLLPLLSGFADLNAHLGQRASRCTTWSRTAYRRHSSSHSGATIFASVHCRTPAPCFGRSPDGSTTTMRSIRAQRSGCAPQGSSAELRPDSRGLRGNGAPRSPSIPIAARLRGLLPVRLRGPIVGRRSRPQLMARNQRVRHRYGTAQRGMLLPLHVSAIQIVRLHPIGPSGADASPGQSHHSNWCSDTL
jgi:hypothetical protein